jgi:hypothetical protein
VARTSQPYRKGSTLRAPGDALRAMLKGATATGYNPQDVKRAAYLTNAARRSSTASRRPLPTRRPLAPRK